MKKKNIFMFIFSTVLFGLGIYMVLYTAESHKSKSIDITFSIDSRFNDNLNFNGKLIDSNSSYSDLLSQLDKFGKNSKRELGMFYDKLGLNIGGYNDKVSYVVIYFSNSEYYSEIIPFKGHLFIFNKEINSNTTLKEIKKLFKGEMIWGNRYFIEVDNILIECTIKDDFVNLVKITL